MYAISEKSGKAYAVPEKAWRFDRFLREVVEYEEHLQGFKRKMIIENNYLIVLYDNGIETCRIYLTNNTH